MFASGPGGQADVAAGLMGDAVAERDKEARELPASDVAGQFHSVRSSSLTM